MQNEKKCKVLLIGDSVFDNVPYVEEGKDTVTTLRKEIASLASVDSAAVDGYTTIEVLFQLLEGNLKHRPKYDFIFLSIGGNDILVNQDAYLNPSNGINDKRIFLDKLRKRFMAIYYGLREMSDNVYWLGVYKPYFDPSEFSESYIQKANQAIHDVNTQLKVGMNTKYMLSISSVVYEPKDFTDVIEPSSVGSEKLSKELKRIVCDSL